MQEELEKTRESFGQTHAGGRVSFHLNDHTRPHLIQREGRERDRWDTSAPSGELQVRGSR